MGRGDVRRLWKGRGVRGLWKRGEGVGVRLGQVKLGLRNRVGGNLVLCLVDYLLRPKAVRELG